MIITLPEFSRNPAVGKYKYNYEKMFEAVDSGAHDWQKTYRFLIETDLFFILYFVMGIKAANHPFVVKMCRMVEDGQKTRTLDVWARGHYKSSIITIAETLQYQLNTPESCTAILAYARPVAKAFLRSIKNLCEQSDFLKACYPDILWNNPEAESPKWSEDDGLIFKRQAAARKESSIEAWGLIEGMPTGRHFERLVFDDIETDDIRDSAEMLKKVYSKFQMAENLGTGTAADVVRVIGTYYSHFGPMIKIGEMVKHENDEPIYKLRKITGSDDGTSDGKPVLFSEDKWEIAKLNEHFYSQQLCDPTPRGEQKLDYSFLKDIEHQFIPNNCYKFMVIDPAGDSKDGKGDAWGIMTVAVEPKADDVGASNIYITDAVISPLRESAAIEQIVRMYLNGGMIMQVGIEKVGLSSVEVHVANALAAKGRSISQDNGSLVILRPAGRQKKQRIEQALAWPLNNGKLYISKSVSQVYRDRLRFELEKFPYWHDDGLDALSYIYDMIKDYRFSRSNMSDIYRKTSHGSALQAYAGY